MTHRTCGEANIRTKPVGWVCGTSVRFGMDNIKLGRIARNLTMKVPIACFVLATTAVLGHTPPWFESFSDESAAIETAKTTSHLGLAPRQALHAGPLSMWNGRNSIYAETNLVYVTTIQIGSNLKPFRVLISTQYAELWVPGVACITGGCSGCSTLGEKDSTSLHMTNLTWKAGYSIAGEGFASGVIVRDTVTLGGLTIPNLHFGVANNMDSTVNGWGVRSFIVDTRHLTVFSGLLH
jgi:Eukaryotic aspartyl protease